MEKTTKKCGYVDCGRDVRMRYPGDDPENGPARPTCPVGHSPCEGCDVWVHGGVCDECGRCPDCDDPTPERLSKLRERGCRTCGSPPFCFDDGPDECVLCGHVIPEGEGERRTVDLDPGNPESGPRPDIADVLVHRKCPSGPKAWEDVGDLETHDERVARLEASGDLDPGCRGCREWYDHPTVSPFAPRHRASAACRSGGRNHCTCDTCF